MSRRPLLPLPPIPVYLTQRVGVAFGLACFLTYANVRRATDLGFDAFDLGLVGSVLVLSAFLFELPTGAVADIFGRRLSMIAGFTAIGVGFAIEAASSELAGVLLAQGTFGLGWALISGARAAWLADEIGEMRFTPVYLRAAQLGHVGSLGGIAMAGVLVQVSLVLPLAVGAVTLLGVSLFVVLCMTEAGFEPTPGESSVARTLVSGLAEVRSHRAAATVVAAEFFLGGAGEVFDRLWQLHLLEIMDGGVLPLLGLTWFAIIDGAAIALAIPALAYTRRWVVPERLHRLSRLLAGLQAGATCAGGIFALASSFPLAAVSWLSFVVLRRTVNPLSTAWINQQLDPRVRATVMSIVNQATALGEAGAAPLGGALERAYGLSKALLLGAGLTTPALGLFVRASHKK